MSKFQELYESVMESSYPKESDYEPLTEDSPEFERLNKLLTKPNRGWKLVKGPAPEKDTHKSAWKHDIHWTNELNGKKCYLYMVSKSKKKKHEDYEYVYGLVFDTEIMEEGVVGADAIVKHVDKHFKNWEKYE